VWLATWLAARAGWQGRRTAVLTAVLAVLACGQGLVYAIHNDIVLTRDDTRTATRDWMVDHIPAGTQILVEPLVPQEWYRDGALPVTDATPRSAFRWSRFVRTRADINQLAKQHPGSRRNADFANYTYTLFPGLLRYYRRRGVCWIVSGSGQSGRAFNNPKRVPQAIRYYGVPTTSLRNPTTAAASSAITTHANASETIQTVLIEPRLARRTTARARGATRRRRQARASPPRRRRRAVRTTRGRREERRSAPRPARPARRCARARGRGRRR